MTIYDEQLKRAEKNKALAQALLQASAPEGAMVSGHYVDPGWAKQLAYGIDQYKGTKGMNEADALEQATQAERAKALEEWQASMPQDTPERQAPIYDDGTNQLIANALKGEKPTLGITSPQQTGTQTIPAKQASPEQRMAWIMKGQQIDPNAAGMGAKYMEMEQARQLAQQKAIEDRIAALQSKQDQREWQSNENQLNRDNQKVGWNIAASNRPEPLVQVQNVDGSITYTPRSQAAGKVAPSKGGVDKNAQNQHIKDAQESNALLDQVEKVGPIATGSGIGAGLDSLGNLVGYSTKSGEAASSMAVLGASLTAKVPKMSGPQSDKDVAMYKEAAGNIANPNVPYARKLAAIKTIREINSRQLGYAESEQSASSSALPSGWSVQEH